MSPFLEIADLADGTFAVLAIDPTKRIGEGCAAIVQSIHATRDEAASAIEARRGETQSGSIADESAAPKADAQPSSEPTP